MIGRSLALLALLLAVPAPAGACTIPVFRFALDRWEADPFHLVIPAETAGRADVQDLLRPLRANGKANLDITTSSDASLKLAELRFSRGGGQLAWSGALDKAALDALLDSPARRQFTERVLAGDSAVWFIAHDSSAAEIERAEQIEKRLRFLEQVAALPIQDPNDPDSQLGPGPPLRLKFAALRVRRDDPVESLLLRMLAGPSGEMDARATSFASVAFAKGRVLGAWPLDAVDDRLLEDACMFLVGRCSCRLKNENPGWDLLLNVDWASELERVMKSGAEAAAAPRVEARKPVAIKATTTQPAPSAAPKAPARGVTWTTASIVGAGLALVFGVALLLSARRGR
jgi:hypothetical protein